MLRMPNTVLSSSHILIHFILITTLIRRYYYFYIFTNENTDRLNDWLKPHSWDRAEMGLVPR